jgi:peptide/nickel transport system substrate-binding protein
MISVFRRSQWWILVLLTVIGAIALASCNPHQYKTQAAQVSQLIVSTLGEPKTFNPALVSEFPNPTLITHEGLTAEDGDGTIIPSLAESWQFSNDKTHLVFQLRQGLKWSDGEPLTAEDVVFTYNEIYFNPAIPTDIRDVLKIGKKGLLPTIRKLDDRHVELILPEPFAPILRASPPILPAHKLREAVRAKDADGKSRFLSTWGTDTDPHQIVGSGPYQLDQYLTSQRVVFRRNPYYWQRDRQGNQQPYIERVIWQIIESSDTEVFKFRSGDLDVLREFGTLRSDEFSLLKREEGRGKFKIVFGGPSSSTNYLTFNLNKGRRQTGQPLINPIKSRWFNTVAFRQAVAYAIDRQSMIDRTFRGLAKPQDSPISVQSPYYLSLKEGLRTYNYNPEKAKSLLVGAGFTYNNNHQLLDADGNLVRFTLLTNAENKLRVAMGAQIRQDLSKIGIQVDFNPIAFNTLIDKIDSTLDWECYLLGFTGGVEPNNGFNVWNPDGGSHYFNLKPQVGRTAIAGREVADWEQRIGDLYIQGAQELDETKRKAIYFETQRLTQDYLPAIHLVNPETMVAVRNHIQGMNYTALGYGYWNIYEQKITEH